VVRTIGLARARVKIGLANLAYNFGRFIWLETRREPAAWGACTRASPQLAAPGSVLAPTFGLPTEPDAQPVLNSR
jgi:hypothetical protein